MTHSTQQRFLYLFFLLSFIYSGALFAQVLTEHLPQKTEHLPQKNDVNYSSLTALQFRQLFQCNKTFNYKVTIGGINAGSLKRTISWHKNEALITSTGKTKILGIGSTYKQVSSLHWSAKDARFYTDHFAQTIKGLDAREMVAKITNKGSLSQVILDDEKTQYENTKAPLYDLDTLGEQLRLELIKGTTSISLFRQASEKIKHYQFKVVGKETIIIEPWGKVEVIRINEVGDYDDTVLWFSPKYDFQLLKAKIDAFINPTVVLTEFKKKCI